MAQPRHWSPDRIIRTLAETTASETGEPFFRTLVRQLAEALDVHGAWITEYVKGDRLRALAFFLEGKWVDHYEYMIAGTPCEAVLRVGRLVHFPDRIVELFPQDPDLPPLGAVSYLGLPLFGPDEQELLGHLAILDNRPMPFSPEIESVFRVFAARAGAELRRATVERALREQTEQLESLVDSAMDAILIFDGELSIARANPAAERTLGSQELVGDRVDRFLSGKGAELLEQLMEKMGEDCRQAWIPSPLEIRTAAGEVRPAEGTLSCFALRDRRWFTLILRDVNERLEAERALRELSSHAAYLREEVELHFGEIIGTSPPMRRVVQEVSEVAPTDATVLLCGETGTGKEQVARAVHRASARSQRPLIKVNCAAIPAALMESEFFGHEKGAFTGATAQRDGRFTLADGGTIFLDEIGELPMELQVKLLRVLQEGELEPVGSSRTRKVDVRVIAATNRDLLAECREGRFREDLYFRLNVFPIPLPPLRERGQDIVLLAQTFVRRFAQRLGRLVPELTESDACRLQEYPWPGNVRELANVIERAVITSKGRELNLTRALPPSEPPGPAEPTAPGRIYTAAELRELERENIRRALDRCAGRVAGPNGAAELLGMRPTTLGSRIKALKVR